MLRKVLATVNAMLGVLFFMAACSDYYDAKDPFVYRAFAFIVSATCFVNAYLLW